jgi:xanthine dehydrogenase accessory factor
VYDDFFQKALELQEEGRPFATATVVRAQKPTSSKPGDRAIVTLDGVMYGWIGGNCAQPTVIREAYQAMLEDKSRLVRITPDPGSESLPEGTIEVPMTCYSGGLLEVYIEPQQPRPRLIVIGHLPVAQALCHLGKAMNYRVLAIAPAGAVQSVAHADEVRSDESAVDTWVNALSFVVVATHGAGDETALRHALTSGAPYVGLVASRTRSKEVLEHLRMEGVSEVDIARIRVPAGLDIQARRGDEIALSIMAEIVRTRRNLEELSWTKARESLTIEGTDALQGAAPETAVDPVCGMTVATATAQYTHDYLEVRYYFCCPGCRARFARDPERYVLSAAGRN